MKTILIISFSHLATDPRVNRQLRILNKYYRVIAAGLGDPDLPDLEFIPIIKRRKKKVPSPKSILQFLSGRYEEWYWNQKHVMDCIHKLSSLDVDLILANDIDTLPAALKLNKRTKVIFDAHEYAPRQGEDKLLWRIFFHEYKSYLCNTYIPRADGMITVCQGIADAYQRDTGIKPIVITNAPDFEDIEPSLSQGKEEMIRLVHHGVTSPSRKIEKLIKMMDYLDERFELNLILLDTNPNYLKQLRHLAEGKPAIHFWPPVPMRSISKHLNQYDIGIYLLEPVNFNFLYSLPNKFFEFIQARLAIAIGPSPEMARLVKDHDLGVVAEDFSPRTLGRCLKSLNREKINYYKLQSNRIAHLMSAEQNKKVLLDFVSRILGE